MSSSFEEFCGGPFWNKSLTWDTDNPDFTECFHKTVLAWFPGLLLALASPSELHQYFTSASRSIPFNWFNVTKLLLTLGLLGISIAELAVNLTDGASAPDVDYVMHTIFILTDIWSIIMLMLSIRYGIRTSPAQFYFYFFSMLCGIPTLRSAIMSYDSENSASEKILILYSIQYGFLVALMWLNLFADCQPTIYDPSLAALKKPCPQINASYFSKLTYHWMTSLLWKGFRRPLMTQDLWNMNPKVSSRGIVPIFDYHYKHSEESADQQNKPVNTFPALLKSFGPMFFIGSAMKIVTDVMQVFSPQIMKLMIGYVTTYAMSLENDAIEAEPAWRGYFYGLVLLAMLVVQSILMNQYFERMYLVAMNVRTALISAIYRKSLKMSGAAKRESSVGEIVNLMSVDVQRFMDLLPYLNMLWSSPLQIGLSCYFIYQELGFAMFSGLAIMLVAIPANAAIANITKRYQIEQMKNKDKRVKLMNEILSGIKVLKMYAWEKSFIKSVLDIRANEIKVLKKSAYLGAFISFIWTSIPFLVALVSFTTYIFMNGGQILDAEKAFVTISYLNLMRIPMAALPFMIIGLVNVTVSIKRIDKFMNNDELDEEAVQHDPKEKDPIVIEKGTFKWGMNEPDCLKDINIRVKKGSITAIVGTVGSGKSSLVSAMLGELIKTDGRVNVNGKVAFVPQQAWMQNATVKQNILFGKEVDSKRYDRVIDATALRSDLNILPAGDSTEIGEKGINLSGGQKQRVSLARAVFSDADVFLLDDPLSAVDSHVGKHIFDNVISHDGELSGKTIVLVTHGITYLPKTDNIIVMKDGKISEQGSYQELIEQKGDFAEFLMEYMTESDELEDEDLLEELKETMGQEFQRQISTVRERKSSERKTSESGSDHPRAFSRQSSHAPSTSGQEKKKALEPTFVRSTSRAESTSEKEKEAEANKEQESKSPNKQDDGKLIEKESTETGSVKFSVYTYYMKNVGLLGTSIIIICQLLYTGASFGTNYWLNVWTDEQLGNSSYPKYRDLYLGVYGGFGFIQAASVMILTIVLAIFSLSGSSKMHQTMLERIMKSPMSFFDTTPLGRIVNRFAKDVDVCDNTLPQNLRQWLSQFATFIGTIVLIETVIWQFIVVIVPVAILFFFIQTIYVNTSRQLKRLESVSRSPIYSHFGETITGASTIRAYGLNQEFIRQSEQLVDNNQVCYYPSIMANRWLAVRLENIGNLVTFAASMLVILQPNIVSASEAGLVISYSLSITQTLNWLVRMTSDVETNIVAVERIKEYSKIKQEANWRNNAGKSLDKAWPQSGKVGFNNYGMRYREGLDLVVKNITCDIKGGETIGIVGRTGAGKSSLTVALFRLVEPAEGQISIDGVDVARIGLHDLRSKLTIIPQDPVLFSGTLRINLDPFDQYSDEAVWKALELSHLKDYATSLEKGLEHEVAEGGENLSVGQRQLVCLARALLRKTKVLILDEATAAVDLETDDLIQSTIRKEFAGCTVLTIAHRLNTIMDYNRIMVLDKGSIKEFDTPDSLLKDTSTIFHSMAKNAGLVNDNGELLMKQTIDEQEEKTSL